ncbi:MAG TPA: hypothetical protein EYQ25_01565 [Planctomycetes bacterium]|nr:hypothetical protein [Planctomycetota bacterium]HIL37740.1 hypothetical protein [Planctomycetota bacterium]
MQTFSLLALLALAACTPLPPTSTQISGEDNSFQGAIQISHPLTETDQQALHYGLRIEVDGSGGEVVETLAGGQTVLLGEVALLGPGDVDLKFDYNFVAIGFYVVKPFNRFNLEGELGFGHSSLDARASLGALSESAEFQEFGLYVGGNASYQLNWPLLLFYRLRGFQGSGDDETSTWETQLGTSWTVNETMTISAGLQAWNYLREPRSMPITPSDLDLTLNGPFLRLEFSF